MYLLLTISFNLAIMCGRPNMLLETKALNKHIICNFLSLFVAFYLFFYWVLFFLGTSFKTSKLPWFPFIGTPIIKKKRVFPLDYTRRPKNDDLQVILKFKYASESSESLFKHRLLGYPQSSWLSLQRGWKYAFPVKFLVDADTAGPCTPL